MVSFISAAVGCATDNNVVATGNQAVSDDNIGGAINKGGVPSETTANNASETEESAAAQKKRYPEFSGAGDSLELISFVEKNVGSVVNLKLNLQESVPIYGYRNNRDTPFFSGGAAKNLSYAYFIDCNGTGTNWDGQSTDRCDGVRWDAGETRADGASDGVLSGYFKILEIRGDNMTAPNASAKNRNVQLLPVRIADDNTIVTAQNPDHFNHLLFAHAAALKRWLAARPDLRPAQTWDYGEDKMRLLREVDNNPKRHPYYVTGDFNKDGRQEFAVILAYRTSKLDAQTKRKINALAVFDAPPYEGDKMQPTFYSEQNDAVFILHANVNGNLGVSSSESDDGFILIPDGKKYKVKMMLEDN